MILLRVQIILDNFLATISKGQSCGQNVSIVAQRAVALPFIISAKKHSPSENGFQLMAHFQAFFFSLRVELETFSALSFQSSVLHSSGFPIHVWVLYPGQVLWGDVGSEPNPRSKYEVLRSNPSPFDWLAGLQTTAPRCQGCKYILQKGSIFRPLTMRVPDVMKNSHRRNS